MKHSSFPDVVVPVGTGSPPAPPWYRGHWAMGREYRGKAAGWWVQQAIVSFVFTKVSQTENVWDIMCRLIHEADSQRVIKYLDPSPLKKTKVTPVFCWPLCCCRLWRLSYHCNRYGVSWLRGTRSKSLTHLKYYWWGVTLVKEATGQKTTMKRDKFQQHSTNEISGGLQLSGAGYSKSWLWLCADTCEGTWMLLCIFQLNVVWMPLF